MFGLNVIVSMNRKRVKYNNPELRIISDNRVIYKGKDFLTVEDLKFMPEIITLIDCENEGV